MCQYTDYGVHLCGVYSDKCNIPSTYKMNKNITVLVYTAPYRYIKNYYSSLRSKCYTSFLRLSTLPLNTNQLKTNVGFTPPKPIQMPRGLDRMSRARNTIAYIDRIRMWVQLTRWHNYNLRRTVYILLLLMWLGNGEVRPRVNRISDKFYRLGLGSTGLR